MKRRDFLQKLAITAFAASMTPIDQLQALGASLGPSQPMPALFLGHGSPMNAITENAFVRAFRAQAATLPRPKAILCISAHWYTQGTLLTAMPVPRTIHDFGGFPAALYAVQYPAQGDVQLANETSQLLQPTSAALDHTWGLDHGTWSVLIHLFPKADVPVVQLSIDRRLTPAQHFDLAKRLSALRHKGVLIVGSGNIVHNLGRVDFRHIDTPDYGYDWAREVRDTSNKWLLEGNYAPLLDYARQSEAFRLAIPTPDHFLPLLYVLATQQKGEGLSLFNDSLVAGSLSMTSVRVG